MTSVLPSKAAGESGLAAFAAAEGSQPIQTPFGSLQLTKPSAQHPALNYLGMAGGSGGGESEEEEEEEEDDDDDEGATKGKRKRSKGGAGSKAGGKKSTKGGAAAVGTAAGDRDMHTGRRKIRIEFIEDDSRRHITFSKRKAGIMKKAYELATLTGTQVLLLIVSQTGLVYTFTTPKLSPVVQQTAGRELIQSCLNAPEPGDGSGLDQGLGNDSNSGDNSQGSSEQDDLAAATDFGHSLSSHTHQGPYAANPFNDAQSGLSSSNNNHHHHQANPNTMTNLSLNMPPLHGLSYGYSGHHMNTHEQSIPYGAYGL